MLFAVLQKKMSLRVSFLSYNEMRFEEDTASHFELSAVCLLPWMNFLTALQIQATVLMSGLSLLKRLIYTSSRTANPAGGLFGCVRL